MLPRILAVLIFTSVVCGQDKPNVIILFADDLGYADLSCYGSTTIATPGLDRMAKEGVRLTDFHTCSPVCTPSRAALLTGTYAARIGLANHVLFPHAKIGLSPNEVTLARLLTGQGYVTMCIGKWHLGDAPEFGPKQHGFDAYFGVPYSNDMRVKIDGKMGPPLMRDDQVIEHPANQSTLTVRYTEEAINFITASKDKPFFLYLPHTFPHVPLFAAEPFKGKSKAGLDGDCVETIDWSTGQILATLKKLNLDEKTIVVFTSDNGPWLIKKENGGSAKPLRDGKGTIYEGGHRVPCIVRWPGKIPADKTSNEFATTMDLYPTLAKLAGASLPKDRVIDGKNIWDLLTAKPGAQSPHDIFFHYTQNGALGAVRSGPWKLHLARTEGTTTQPVEKPFELYNLADDIGETKNLVNAHPIIVQKLARAADAHVREIATNARAVGKLKDASGEIKTDRGASDRR
jgi:arylsulfatase A-like enzyme